MRAVVEDLGGWEKAQAQFEAGEVNITAWMGVKAMPRASRVAGFIVLWAAAMRLENLDEFSITEYQRYWNESERQAYRLQREFRELWPEYETPNEGARHLVSQIDRGRVEEGLPDSSDDVAGDGMSALGEDGYMSPAQVASRSGLSLKTFASLLIREGASAVAVAAQMGNAPSVTLDTYAHLFDERDPVLVMDPAAAIEAARREFDVREVYAECSDRDRAGSPEPASEVEALSRTRTADPLLRTDEARLTKFLIAERMCRRPAQGSRAPAG